MTAENIIHFWFEELKPADWFIKNPELDQLIHSRFSEVHQMISQDKINWQDEALASLAKIIVLDQFSRNMFRDTAQAFAFDEQAREICYHTLKNQYDSDLSIHQKAFLYMPLMHSESLEDHQRALKLYAIPGLEDQLHYEKMHYDIIKRFGRYPHRNATLNRQSTPQEINFLQEDNSSF